MEERKPVEAILSVKMSVGSSTQPSSGVAGSHPGEIVLLNVGGKRFSTSRQTLTWIPDSFFSSLMSGRIPSLKDETGAIFIDRDPDAFVPILNFMRTRSVDLRNVDIKTLKHEAEFFGIIPLVKRLAVCDELERSSCGSLLFYCRINPPIFDLMPTRDNVNHTPQPQLPLGLKTDFSRQVLQITGHGNCIAAAYNHCICVFNVRESRGWDELFTTPPLERVPQRIALNTAVSTRSAGGGMGNTGPILAAALGNEIKVWSCTPSAPVLASFDMKISVDGLFFIGMQLVAISNTGKVAVWQSVQKHWQLQEVEPICSYDMAASFLLLGCTNGSIYYIDMEKFPVRMKDNDLLVTQLFEDPCKEAITALSVYFTPNVFPGSGQNWMEVAYGTRAGTVRVVVRHPENIGQAPQIFQTYSVHTCPIMRVVLGEKHLISVCAENHVRSWTVTRFRGRISTQPGSTPIASFKVLSLEGAHSLFYPINSIGPFGERDEEQVFIQRVIPETSSIFIRHSSTGNRVCKIESVDDSNISSYCVHECEGINRTGLRSRRFIFTGHLNGSIQVWDLTTALELSHKNPENISNGPTKEELLDLLQNCDVSTSSRVSSVVSSRAPSPSPSLMSIMYPGLKLPSATPPLHTTTSMLLGTGSGRMTTSSSSASRLGVGGLGVAGSGSAYDNLFQPIQTVSQSPSSNSISSTTPCSNGGGAVQDQSVVSAASLQAGQESETREMSAHCSSPPAFEIEREGKTRLNSYGENDQITSNGSDLAQLSGKVEEFQNTGSKVKLDISVNPQVHQRSRSNEIDYTSIGYDNRALSISAFRSPPGTMRGFRPQSIDSAHGSLFSDITDSLSSAEGASWLHMTTFVHSTSTSSATQRVSSLASSNRNSSSSEATVVGAEREEVVQTAESASGHDSSSTSVAGGARESDSLGSDGGKQQLTLDWLKDFDPGLISDYFSSSDEPRLKVTD